MRQKRSLKGQISVLIILSLIPLFTLFAFAVNVGMLVNAKISLQNAADLAAYSGAATQARQLTAISHLNYKLRQNYKKFLFKYYVMGNISLKCFPRQGMPAECTPGYAGTFDWKNPGVTGYPGVPTTCISMTSESNPCQLGIPLPTVQPPSCSPIDPTCNALTNSALGIAQIQQQSCKSNSSINASIMAHWLYSPSYTSDAVGSTNLLGLVSEPGLMIESFIDYNRIKTMQKFVNYAPQVVTPSTVSILEKDDDQAKTERSVLAFKTALKNLNDYVFDYDTVEMDELLPRGIDGADLLGLEYFHVKFDAAYTVMETAPNVSNCNIATQKISADPYLGVYKNNNKLIYYAIKLTAKARLLFNPFPFNNADSSLELTAYAAAMPFGSRIGPKLDAKDFIKPMTSKPKNEAYNIPTIPAIDINNNVRWDSKEVLLAFHNSLKTSIGGTAAGAVSTPQLNYALAAALLPEESEIGKYNIPVETGELPTVFKDGTGKPSTSPYTFWAPLYTGNDLQKFVHDSQDFLEEVSAFAIPASGDAPDASTRAALKGFFTDKLGGLTSELQTRNNLNVARINDPLSAAYFSDPSNSSIPPIPGKVSDPKRLPSSYVTNLDFDKYQAGRDGYSVKMVSFQSLMKKSNVLTNINGGNASWELIDAFGLEKSNLSEVEH